MILSMAASPELEYLYVVWLIKMVTKNITFEEDILFVCPKKVDLMILIRCCLVFCAMVGGLRPCLQGKSLRSYDR